MATIYTFLCEGCNYTAEVAGESSALFAGQTETMICKDCKSLYDAVKGFTFNEDGEEGFYYSACEECDSENNKRWNYSKKPCPRCGEKMEIDPYAVVVEAD